MSSLTTDVRLKKKPGAWRKGLRLQELWRRRPTEVNSLRLVRLLVAYHSKQQKMGKLPAETQFVCEILERDPRGLNREIFSILVANEELSRILLVESVLYW